MICAKNNCHWCGYEDANAVNCRPKRAEDNMVGINNFQKKHVCPDDESNPFAQRCTLFPNCPTPEEMTACPMVSNLPMRNFRKAKMCREGFKVEINGEMVTIGPKRCSFNHDECHPLGDYYFAFKTITNIPGFFDLVRSPPCPKAKASQVSLVIELIFGS